MCKSVLKCVRECKGMKGCARAFEDMLGRGRTC